MFACSKAAAHHFDLTGSSWVACGCKTMSADACKLSDSMLPHNTLIMCNVTECKRSPPTIRGFQESDHSSAMARGVGASSWGGAILTEYSRMSRGVYEALL
jgi:hypothetical protein